MSGPPQSAVEAALVHLLLLAPFGQSTIDEYRGYADGLDDD